MTARNLSCETVNSLFIFNPALCKPDHARRDKIQTQHFNSTNFPDIIGCVLMKLGRDDARVVMDMDPDEEIHVYHGSVLLLHDTINHLCLSDSHRKHVRFLITVSITNRGSRSRNRKNNETEAKHLLINYLHVQS